MATVASRRSPTADKGSDGLSSVYSFGIEEEYFLTKLDSRDTCNRMPAEFAHTCHKELGGIFDLELLQSQVEVATPPCTDMAAARAALSSYRATLGQIGAEFGLGIVAAGTHPKALWSHQTGTDKTRYRAVMRDLQMLGQRNMVCGMHVHVAVPDPERRVDLMLRATPYLPILLALSASSPFWQGRRTGLMAYRLAAYDELPRTGLPVIFKGKADFDHYIETMMAAGAIKDSSYIWWAIRPSLRYPTLELRIADSCTSVDDAISIAALYRALVRRLDRDDSINANLTPASGAIAFENKWRAERYGIRTSFIDEKRQQALPFKETLDNLIELVHEDAEALGCLDEVLSARNILKHGPSASSQVAIFDEEIKNGARRQEALSTVVDWLLSQTVAQSSNTHQPKRSHDKATSSAIGDELFGLRRCATQN